MNDSPFVIVGSGRSGTTWVLDVLAETNKLKTIFEPLNPFAVKSARGFAYHYYRENDSEPELKQFMEDVFSGRFNCRWTNVRVPPMLLQFSLSNLFSHKLYGYLKRRSVKIINRYIDYFPKQNYPPITKFIRANLMLEWLFYNFHVKLIFIVRHPGAVVASKISSSKTLGGREWDFNSVDTQKIMSLYKNDSQLHEDFLQKYDSIFSEKLTPAAGLTLLWCVENILPIYKLQQRNYPVFFYEDIVLEPEREFERMNRVLGFEKMPSSVLINRPSQQSSRDFKRQDNKMKKLTRWMNVLSRQEISEVGEVLNFFNVALYTTREPLPVNRVQETI